MPLETYPEPNRIILTCFAGAKVVEEGEVATTFKPGHFLDFNSSGKYIPASGDLPSLRMIAVESSLEGKTINDAYAVGTRGQAAIVPAGSVVYARLAAGQNVARNARLAFVGGGAMGAVVAGTIYAISGDSAAVAATASETTFDKSVTIPANQLKVGDVIRVRALANATATVSTDTVNVKLKIGGLTIAATGAVDPANGDVAFIDIIATITAIGASGSIRAAGLVGLGAPGTVTGKVTEFAPAAIDTTAAVPVIVTAQWSTANANSIKLTNLTVRLDKANVIAGVPVAIAEEAKDNSAGTDEVFIRVRVL